MRKVLTGLVLVLSFTITGLVSAAPAEANHRWPTHARVITNARYFDRNEVPFFEMTIRAEDWRGKFVKGNATLWVNGHPERRRPLMHGWRGFRIDRSDLRNNARNRIQIRIDPDSPHRRVKVVTRYVVDRTQTRGDKVVDVALDQVGDRYSWAAAGPDAFDCSGYIVYSFRRALGKRLPHSSDALRHVGRQIPRSQAKPGDIFWTKGHVSLYIGNGRVAEAANPRSGVRVTKVWQRNPVVIRAW